MVAKCNNECCFLTLNVPKDMRPIVYYVSEGDTMLVAF